MREKRINRPIFVNIYQRMCTLLYIFLIILSIFIIISESTAQPQKEWVWSVKGGDIKGHDESYRPDFYMINDSVNVSWNIIPSPSSTLVETLLRVYPKEDDKSKYEAYKINIPPNEGYMYVPLVDLSSKNNETSIQKIYNVEVDATAIDQSQEKSSVPNEWHTHKIEIKVNNAGTLVIQKRIPGWDEADLSGWRFRVEGPVDTRIKKTLEGTTDSSGKTVFSGLRPGMYQVEETTRDGWLQIPLRTVLVEPGSSMPQGPNKPQEFINTPNELTINNRDSEDRPLPGWSFIVKGPGQSEITEPTDDRGVAVIKGLVSGEHDIQDESSPEGWRRISTIPDLPIKFGSGENRSLTITNAREGSISITKLDSEGNPLAGWSFSVAGPDSKTVTTDGSGRARAEGLLPGTYTIKEIPQNEIEQTKWINVTEVERTVILNPGEDKQLEPFINAKVVSLVIVKFDDQNGNGRLDRDGNGSSLESGLSGWTYTVRGERGFKRDVGPTDSNGIIALDLTPGEYSITEEISPSARPGWKCTSPNPQQVKISGHTANRVEFGNRVNRLTMVSFNDSDMNGNKGSDETGLVGWKFLLRGPDGEDAEEIETQLTDSLGVVSLDGLVPGSYRVTEILKSGWANTTPISTAFQVPAGEEMMVEVGNVNLSRIEIFKFNDTNRNGELDAGEGGVSGFSFLIRGPDGFANTTSLTNAEGITVADKLTYGDYTITEIQADRWMNTTPSIREVELGYGDTQRVVYGNYYCQRCHRINDQPKVNNSADQNLFVEKKVSDISAERIDKNGYPVNYSIRLCPNGDLVRLAAVPTDILIAVDNSRSISNLDKIAVSGVERLVEGIARNDTGKVTRVGLVSWSDSGISRTHVSLTNNYSSVARAASKIVFPEGNHTDYQEALNSAMRAFQESESIAGRTKKIVLITDASDNGYIAPTSIPGDDYIIYAIVVGNHTGTEPYRMLEKLTRDHNGYIRSINDMAGLQDALIKMSTAGSKVRDVKLVETLPNYMILNYDTVKDDSGRVQLNRESEDWSTTTISWDVGDLSGCWNTTFEAFFCWKLPAEANHQQLASYVNYTDEEGVKRTIPLPEYEIDIVLHSGEESQIRPLGEVNKQPGFGSLLGMIGMLAAGLYARRR